MAGKNNVCVPPKILILGPNGPSVEICKNCYEDKFDTINEEPEETKSPEETEDVVKYYEIISITADGKAYMNVSEAPEDSLVKFITEKEVGTDNITVRVMKEISVKDLKMLINDDHSVLDEFTEKIIDKKE